MFIEGRKYDIIDGSRQRWHDVAQHRGVRLEVLACNDALIVAVKGPDTGEPLVGDHCQGVLIGSCLGLPLDVLWSHVADRADERGHALRDAPAEAGQAEVRQQHLTVLPQEHVFWLDIQVDHTLVMRVL